ncbi:hypothetical protein ACJRO7_009939 [Eucalyptus globulus]|uniref:Uncharacterized protein n=1 Tax=Eucalyptus globulus TaxID=34317 RepID=A0ABD3LB76_EUCGL
MTLCGGVMLNLKRCGESEVSNSEEGLGFRGVKCTRGSGEEEDQGLGESRGGGVAGLFQLRAPLKTQCSAKLLLDDFRKSDPEALDAKSLQAGDGRLHVELGERREG